MRNSKRWLSAILAATLAMGSAPLAAGAAAASDVEIGAMSAPVYALYASWDGAPQAVTDFGDLTYTADNNKQITVTGTAEYVSGFEGFNKSISDEQAGYYATLQFAVPDGVTVSKDVTIITVGEGDKKKEFQSGVIDEVGESKDQYFSLILWLGGDEAAVAKRAAYPITVDWDGPNATDYTASAYTLNFSGITPRRFAASAAIDYLGTSGVSGAFTEDAATVTGNIDPETYAVTDATAKSDFAGAVDTEGKPVDGRKFMLAKIAFTGLKADQEYTVRQTNAGMNYAFNVSDFPNEQKVKDYTGAVLADGLNFVLANGKSPVTFEVQLKGDDANTFDDNAFTQTFTITNELTFAPTPVVVGAPSFAVSEEAYLGKDPAEYMTGVKLNAAADSATSYTLTGTAAYVTGWEAFNSTVEEEQSGHYVAIKVTKPDNFPSDGTIAVKGASEKTWSSANFFTMGSGTYEILIMRLDAITDKKFTIAFDEDGANEAKQPVTYTFDFSGMELTPKTQVVVPPAVNDDKATVSVPDNAIADAVTEANGAENATDKVVGIDVSKDNNGEEITNVTATEVELPADTITALNNITADTKVEIATPVGTVTLDKAAVEKINAASLGASGAAVTLAVEKQAPAADITDAVSAETYEINFKVGAEEVAMENVGLTLTLRFSNITDPAQVKILAKNSQGAIAEVEITSYSEISAGVYDFVIESSHLTTFYAAAKEVTPPTPTTGTITKTEASGQGLGKRVEFTIANAADGDHLTIAVKRGSMGQTCVVIPVSLTGGNGTATVYIQSDATVDGAWITKGAPNFTAGSAIPGGILASL